MEVTIGTQKELGLAALVKAIMTTWLANWQLGIDGTFQQVTGGQGAEKGVGGDGCYCANVIQTHSFL